MAAETKDERHARLHRAITRIRTRKQATLAQDIGAMMTGWNQIETRAREQFPNATKEELYAITRDAMNHAIRRGK